MSLARAKKEFSYGTADTAQDTQIATAISAASDWVDDKAGPVVQRTVDGVVVGRFADTASVTARFQMATLMFAGWLLRAYTLRSAPVDGYDAPAFAGSDPPVDAIRLLLGDDWVDAEVTADREALIGSITLGVWSTP